MNSDLQRERFCNAWLLFYLYVLRIFINDNLNMYINDHLRMYTSDYALI